MDRKNAHVLGVIVVILANYKFLKPVFVELSSNSVIAVNIHGRNPAMSIASSRELTSQFVFKCASRYAGSWRSCSIF